MQRRGLIVSLMSKAFGLPKHVTTTLETQKIHREQRKLAEITDMIHTSYQMHRRVMNIREKTKDFDDIRLSNTMSILAGDSLLANASMGLARLHRPLIVEMFSKSIANISEGEFLYMEEFDTSKQMEMLDKYCYLSGGSLLAHSCRSALYVADYDERSQQLAFDIGKNIGIAFHLSDLLIPYSEDNGNEDKFDSRSIKSLLNLNIDKVVLQIENLKHSDASLAISKIVLSLR